MKEKLIRQIIMFLSIIGVGLATYLLYEYMTSQTLGICNISETVNCEPITKGALATVFGVLVAIIGLIGYMVIFLSTLFKSKKMAVGMTAFGMLFCLRLTILEIFVERVICPVCVMCQIIMLIVFVLSLVWLKKPEEKV
ncbi:MAG: vitamin K epoxide reductase family protein [Patescibacteria group bacterium]